MQQSGDTPTAISDRKTHYSCFAQLLRLKIAVDSSSPVAVIDSKVSSSNRTMACMRATLPQNKACCKASQHVRRAYQVDFSQPKLSRLLSEAAMFVLEMFTLPDGPKNIGAPLH